MNTVTTSSPGSVAQALRTLPIDVEQHVASLGKCLLDRLSRRAIIIVEHHRPFEKLAPSRMRVKVSRSTK